MYIGEQVRDFEVRKLSFGPPKAGRRPPAIWSMSLGGGEKRTWGQIVLTGQKSPTRPLEEYSTHWKARKPTTAEQIFLNQVTEILAVPLYNTTRGYYFNLLSHYPYRYSEC